MTPTWISYSYGIGLCIAISAIAIALSPYIPLGSVTLALIVGIIIGNSIKLPETVSRGITFSEKQLLSCAIALMGVNLDFRILNELGLRSILLVILALLVTISTSLLLSKLGRFNSKMALLLGIGNGVCGSSAIAATAPLIRANEEEVGLSVAMVNLLSTIGMFLVPIVATIVFAFSDIQAGILVGNTLQSVGHVVAAGFSISDSAGQSATLIKMTRILMIIPLMLLLILAFSDSKKGDRTNIDRGALPLFIVGFILFSFVPTFNMLPAEQIHIISKISDYALITAMSGIGLTISIQTMVQNGKAVLLMGGLIFVVQVLFNSVMVSLLFY
ncbi:MAG: putative sulfate exporter family transporter [Chloroflexota bacterium]